MFRRKVKVGMRYALHHKKPFERHCASHKFNQKIELVDRKVLIWTKKD